MTSNLEDDAPSSRLRWLAGGMLLLIGPLVLVWWPGCREYPAATSRESLGLMKLLYAACNTEDASRLAQVEAGVEKLARAGKLPPAEQEAFAKIVGMAKAGDWDDAEQAALKFAQDQVGVGHPVPEGNDHSDAKPGKTALRRGKSP